jgi:hypothetical protein
MSGIKCIWIVPAHNLETGERQTFRVYSLRRDIAREIARGTNTKVGVWSVRESAVGEGNGKWRIVVEHEPRRRGPQGRHTLRITCRRTEVEEIAKRTVASETETKASTWRVVSVAYEGRG